MVAAFAVFLMLAGCGGVRTAWDGRRGYDGNGDYGYALAASRSEAHAYRATAAAQYAVPGTPDDPWGPYIVEASGRYGVPERWIRAVMHQESGGRLYDADGSLITSGAGAMGLMQVMPGTYDILRQRYALGSDPYDPRDNILAGAAYIHEMYQQFGAPGFLAAYNAGPDRVAAYLAGGTGLPDETVNYLASITPNLGADVAMTGPFAAFAGGVTPTFLPAAPAGDPDAAYAGGGMIGPSADDPANRAYDGGGLVTADAPTGLSSAVADASPPPAMDATTAPTTVPSAPVVAVGSAPLPVLRAASAPSGGWAVQVGAYADPAVSRAAVASARARAAMFLAAARPIVAPVPRDGVLYRARLTGLSAASAEGACAALQRAGMDCLAVPPGS